MYCPECGKEIDNNGWQCAGCGVDIRRIVKEERWGQLRDSDGHQPAGERFNLPERSPEAYQTWRSGHSVRRKQVLAIAGTAMSMVFIVGMMFALFICRSGGENAATIPPVETPPDTEISAGKETVPTESNPSNAITSLNTPSPGYTNGEKTNVEEVKSRVEEWRKAWEHTVRNKDASAFGRFYADDFKSSSGKSKADFLKTLARQADERAKIIVEIEDMDVQTAGGVAVATFKQNYLSDRFGDSGAKNLTFVKRGGKLLIIKEDFEDHTPPARMSVQQIKDLILKWRTAWEGLPIEKKLGPMTDFYHPDFRNSVGAGKDRFLARRLETAKKRSIYTIDVQNVHVWVMGDRAVASFDQMFKSDEYSDQSTKILVFKIHGGKPKIIFEDSIDEQRLHKIEVEDFWGP